jgi:hypothetical protein
VVDAINWRDYRIDDPNFTLNLNLKNDRMKLLDFLMVMENIDARP